MTPLASFRSLKLLIVRSLNQHALSTLITACSIALGAGLLMAIMVLNTQTYQAFTGGDLGFDAVLGARGSKLQLVLNTVFHLETSPGNIPWSLYESIQKIPYVTLAIPYALGDNYRSFRIIGTTDAIFDRFEYQVGKKFRFAEGEKFDTQRREAVLGSYVAQKTGLEVGSIINPYHGLFFDESQKHPQEYVIVGILENTNTPSDRVIWIPIEGVFRMEGHVLSGTEKTSYKPKPGEEIPDEHKEVSSVMIQFKDPGAGFLLDQTINKQGKVATLAWPIAAVMAELFDKIGWVNRILELVAYLVIVVAAGSVLASLYNTMNERKREFAILRALGAKRSTVFSVILLESATISFLGTLLGYLVYLAILTGASIILKQQIGLVLDLKAFHPVLVFTPLGMVALGTLAGMIPAYKAYQTDVASLLTPLT
jgi:putative ABC transport system permease protein